MLLLSCVSEKANNAFSKIESGILDRAELLTAAQEDSISSLIQGLKRDVGSEVFVLTVNTLAYEKLEELSLRMADSLRIGRSTHNDGLLIMVALTDRKARIEVGTGLENIIRDEIAARVMRNTIVPNFEKEKYSLALYTAVSEISTLIRDNRELVGTKPTWK